MSRWHPETKLPGISKRLQSILYDSPFSEIPIHILHMPELNITAQMVQAQLELNFNLMKRYGAYYLQIILVQLVRNMFLNDTKHGFLPNKSLLTNMLYAQHDISTLLETRPSANAIFLDFTKAFNISNHRLVLGKLEHSCYPIYGACGLQPI